MSKLIVSDCDLTLWCGNINTYECCPGNEKLIYELEDLVAAGATLVLWSGSGSQHAFNVGMALSLPFTAVRDKLPHPITDEAVMKSFGDMFGSLPDIQYDDRQEEAIPGVKDFRLIEDYNPHGLTLRRGLWMPDED